MKQVRPLITYEFRRFKGLSRLALIFILIIPLLYGGIYLHANWDLYGNIDEVKVAIVDKDEPAQFNGKEIAGGKLFESALKANKTFDWIFLGEDEAKANEGLADGEYYMVIEVPKDFSKRLVSAGDYKPARAKLVLHRDDANGFIIGTLVSKAEDALGKTLDAAVSQTYFEALFANVEEIKSQLTTAADGSKQLDDGLSQAADGVHQLDEAISGIDTGELQSHVDGVADSIRTIDAGVGDLASASDTMRSGLAQVTGVGKSLTTGAASVRAALAPVKNFVDKTLPDLQDKSLQIGEINAKLVGGENGGLTVDLSRHISDTSSALDSFLSAHPELANDPNLQALRSSVGGTSEASAKITHEINAQAELNASISVFLDPRLLSASVEAAKSANETLDKVTGDVDSGMTTINQGLDQAGDATAKIHSGSSDIFDAAQGLLSKVPAAISSVLKLQDALGRLDTAMPQLSDGAHQLATGLKDGADKIPALDADQQKSMSSIMASPVDIEQKVDHDALYYGRGLAPMFFTIALWVACVSIFLVVRTISGRALASRAGSLRTLLFGFGPVASVLTAGAFVMGYGVWLLLGLDPVHPWLFALLLLTVALSFAALAYVVRLLAGSVQTAIFLVALILQLPACGGTFPVAMLDSFYQALAVISPMRYAVDAFRVVISGGNMAVFWGSWGVLFAVLIFSLVATMLVARRRKRFSMRDIHPPMVTSTSTADYAFSVRPR